MRNEKILKFIFICLSIVIGLIILNILFLSAVRRQYSPGTKFSHSLYNLTGQFSEWAGYVDNWRNLSKENENLKKLLAQKTSNAAIIQSLEQENDRLRRSLNLANRLRWNLVPAGIFNISLGAEGHYALINKGEDSGIREGQAVVSSEGVLVGKINSVFSSSSQVMLVSDPNFSITVKVLGGEASGILRGALDEGLILDLVTQSDQIIEEDTLITTGDDLTPSGLVVGVVRIVENNETQLFKKVKVRPAMDLTDPAVSIIK